MDTIALQPKVTSRGVRIWCCLPGCLSTYKTMNMKIRQVKSAIIGNLSNEQTGMMEYVRIYKYNRASRYWTLERCEIETKGAEIYHLCNQHEVERIMKLLHIKINGDARIERHEFEVPKPI